MSTAASESWTQIARLDHVSGLWENPIADFEFPIVLTAPWGMRLLSITTELDEGSMDIDLRVDGEAYMDESISVTTTKTRTALPHGNDVAAASELTIVASNLAGSPSHLAFTLVYQVIRELP